jgi:hypothetical protein
MMIRNLFFILLTAMTNHAFADSIGYGDTVRLKVVSQHFIIYHYHNWSQATTESRYKMISTNQDPFTDANDYAYIECFDKKTGKRIFKKPSSALTKIEISKDEKYIIGISNIMVWNPYQLIIYSTNGELIKKRHIASEEAKLTKEQFAKFKNEFPEQFIYLNKTGKIFKNDSAYIIDFVSMNMPTELGKAWDELYKYITPNHLSSNFSESVTNWVWWFYEKTPCIVFNYQENMLVSISLLDPKQKRITIKLIE